MLDLSLRVAERRSNSILGLQTGLILEYGIKNNNRKLSNFAGHGSVVQWIEYQIPVLRVEGSSPSGVTGSSAECEVRSPK